MKQIQINLFSTYERRLGIIFSCLDQLNKLPTNLKEQVSLVVFVTKELEESWKVKLQTIRGLDARISTLVTNSYMERTMEAAGTNCKYSIRLDDDLFIPTKVWEFLLTNINHLDDPRILSLSPSFSTGIPSCDKFIESFCSEEIRTKLYDIFKSEGIPTKPWHPFCDYSHVKLAIDGMNKWDPVVYWDEVARHNTCFKSIHPIRFSNQANVVLNDAIMGDFARFLNPTDMNIVEDVLIANTHPFGFLTETWRKALERPYDSFDEISMTMHGRNNNLPSCVILGGWALHPAHGYVQDREAIENKYAQFLTTYFIR